MEAAAQRPVLQQQQQRPAIPSATSLPNIDVVRALHQTVISLRTALDSSREELRRLKEHQHREEEGATGLGEAVERLALENHVLRSRLLGRSGEFSSDAATSPPPNPALDKPIAKMEEAEVTGAGEEKSVEAIGEVVEEEEETEDPQGGPPPDESKLVASQGASNESENESEELDDIELIFTTEETCRDVGLQEDLVSFTDSDNWQPQRTPTPSEAHKSILKTSGSQSTSLDAANGSSGVCNGARSTAEKTGSVEEAAGSSQSSSIDREESVDRFDESSSSRLNKMWSQCSVLVETDISKCGVLEELDQGARHAARRNTLAAPPAAYRPIIHREALAAGRRKSSAPLRPVMDSRSGGGGVGGGGRKESGAQTDISALPAQWRSESYLAHKVAHAFTTLPSKFALPAAVPSRLRLSDKTREARRVMLSDISFTSMVPELSRSADHLCHDPQFPQGHCYTSRAGAGAGGGGAGLRTPETSRRESWLGRGLQGPGGLPSPCDCRLSTELYSARYRGSLSSIPSPGGSAGASAPPGPDGCLLLATGPSRRHSWRPNAAASFDGWRAPAVLPHAAAAGCGHLARPTWSSMPSSPTHVQPPPAALVARLAASPARTSRSKVTFQDCPLIRGSLPNLRSESLAENSGDSTESLIDEAEDYLRRSIDSMLTISVDRSGTRPSARRRRTRRHSEPDLFREWNPPHDARPYLPKIPRDLKLDHLVKVISPEGRILQGRVRYVGPVAGRDEVHVGVELPSESGSSDGTFHGRRYFDCETERAVFVPFKKVVLAWCTT